MARPARARRRLIAGLILAGLLISAHAAPPPLDQPKWKDVSAQQKQILAPLAADWDQLEDWRRKKWLDIAQRYPTMGAEEQARMQRRMKDWASLKPEERTAARERFKNVQKATPEQREALKQMWSEYKALPEEEKKRIKEQAAGKPASAGAK